MKEARPFGISLIAGFYILGAVVLFYTALSGNVNLDKYTIATRLGVGFLPEIPTRLGMAVLSALLAAGLLMLRRWCFWLFVVYSIYFFTVSLISFVTIKDNLFFGNMFSSACFLIYISSKKSYFLITR